MRLPQSRTAEVLILTSLAFFLRFYRLGFHSLWLDEVVSVRDASHSFAEIPSVIISYPPLWAYVTRAVYLIFGQNDFWLRVPSATFGALTVLLMYHVTHRFIGRRTALWAALLLTVSPFHILYSQELRMYTLVALEALATLYFWEQGIRLTTWTVWVGYALSCACGLYTHNWFTFLVISQGIWWIFHILKEKKQWRIGFVAYGFIALVYLPWVPCLIRQSHQPVFNHLVRPGIYEIAETYCALTGFRVFIGDAAISVPPYALPWLLWISSICLLLGFWREDAGRSTCRRLFWVGCVMPLAFGFVFSRLIKPIYLPSRYTLIALPAFLMLAARGVAVERGSVLRNWRTAMGVVWVSSVVMLFPSYYQTFEKGSWRQMAELITSRQVAGDAVVTDPLGWTWIALEYYLPPNLDRIPNLMSDRVHKRVFIPVYGKQISSGDVRLGLRTAQAWHLVSVRQFLHGSIVILERTYHQ